MDRNTTVKYFNTLKGDISAYRKTEFTAYITKWQQAAGKETCGHFTTSCSLMCVLAGRQRTEIWLNSSPLPHVALESAVALVKFMSEDKGIQYLNMFCSTGTFSVCYSADLIHVHELGTSNLARNNNGYKSKAHLMLLLGDTHAKLYSTLTSWKVNGVYGGLFFNKASTYRPCSHTNVCSVPWSAPEYFFPLKLENKGFIKNNKQQKLCI